MTARRLTPTDVDKTVARLNEERTATHFRDPYRPDAVFLKNRGRRPVEIVRAQGRIRTAAYRNALDRRGAPTSQQIGMALVAALVTARLDEITEADRGIVGRALVDLHARGFNVKEAQAMLRRLRNRLVDPADREGEAGNESLVPSSWPRAPGMPF
ncbi:MAG: hypothetical protein Q8N51_02135 [Gammaproteobacteria bacterium]|nr:hypothetical protein [Gammaproteobacteria bacterium]